MRLFLVPLIALAFLLALPPAGPRVTAGEDGRGPALSATATGNTTVTLLHPGKEPRRVIRYRFREGVTETLLMRLDTALTISADGQGTQRATLPGMDMTIDFESRKITPEGHLDYAFVLRDTNIRQRGGIPEETLGEMRAGLAKLVGMSGTGIATTRGESLAVSFEVPGAARKELGSMSGRIHDQLEGLAAPLPEEPVGEGARWQATMKVVVDGVKVNQTVNFRLLSISGQRAVLKLRLSQGAPRQRLKLPGIPRGARADLERLKTRGTGSMVLDLNSLIPRVDMHLDLEMDFVVSMRDEKARCITRLEMDVSMHRQVARETTTKRK